MRSANDWLIALIPENSLFSITLASFYSLSSRRQVLHDQLLLNLPMAGRQQG